MGLRARFITILVIIMLIGFGAAALLTSGHTEQMLMDQVETRGNTLIKTMAPPCVNAMANGEFEVVDAYLGRVSQGQKTQELGLAYLMILDHDGRIYAHSDPTRFGQEPQDPFYKAASQADSPLSRMISDDRGRPLFEVTGPLSSGLRWGTLVAAMSISDEKEALTKARTQILLWSVLLSLFCGLLLYLALTKAVLRPIKLLSQVTSAFADGRLEQRVHPKGRDELSRLGHRFDHMASQIQSYTGELERKVERRATEIVKKNKDLEELNSRLVAAVSQLEELAVTDELTGLFNRRKFSEALNTEINRNERTAHPFSLIMVDVDHFKNYNDTNGHPAGDQVLKELAETMADNLRLIDLIARYGGEEFVILLLDTELEGARIAAAKLRELVVKRKFEHGEKQPSGNLTISLGVASFPHHGRTADEIISAADKALYRAKEAGRNRVEVARSEEGHNG